MTAGRISKRAARLTALALFLTISFLLAALPLHHAGHLCSGAGCPVCLSISKWQRDGSAPLPPLQTEAAALAALEAACADQYGLFTEQIFPCGLDYSEPVVKG